MPFLLALLIVSCSQIASTDEAAAKLLRLSTGGSEKEWITEPDGGVINLLRFNVSGKIDTEVYTVTPLALQSTKSAKFHFETSNLISCSEDPAARPGCLTYNSPNNCLTMKLDITNDVMTVTCPEGAGEIQFTPNAS